MTSHPSPDSGRVYTPLGAAPFSPIHLAAGSDEVLDAAETLVTLQTVDSGGGVDLSPTGGASDKSPSRYTFLNNYAVAAASQNKFGHKLDDLIRMPPPGAPPPPAAPSTSFQFAEDEFQSTNSDMMRPPADPPPNRRGRGRGSRGGSGRGRGRGRGRGSAGRSRSPTGAGAADVNLGSPEDRGGDATSPARSVGTFQVGGLTLSNAVFDDVLNARKVELLHDPEIVAILRMHKLGKAKQK